MEGIQTGEIDHDVHARKGNYQQTQSVVSKGIRFAVVETGCFHATLRYTSITLCTTETRVTTTRRENAMIHENTTYI